MRRSGYRVVFYINDGYTFSRAEQRTIETIATQAAQDAKRLLPGLPDQLTLRVNPGKRVMAETGQTGETAAPNVVYWMVDPGLYGGVIAIAERQLRSTLLHEFHHLARAGTTTSSESIMDRVISEGLATAFERDFGDVTCRFSSDHDYWRTVSMRLRPGERIRQKLPIG